MPRVNRREATFRKRLRVAQGLFALAVLGILFKGYKLSLSGDERLERWAKSEYEKSITLSPQRGEIYDQKGRSLASSITVKSIYADPRQVKDKGGAARELSRSLSLGRNEMLEKLGSKRRFVWIERKVTPDVFSRIKDLSISGLGALDESKRFYPNIDLASNVLGFTGLDSNGLSGIELRYDGYLRNRESKYTRVSDALGRRLFTDDLYIIQFDRGNDVYLTLDQAIQYVAEAELDKALERSESSKGYVIVMEPSTGKVLAMVSRPKFNPNDYGKANPSSWMNGAVSLVYEPGSTFKVFVAAAALEEGAIDPKDLFYCKKGSLTVADKNIRDTSDKLWLNPSGIIKYSSNIGAAKIAMALGSEKLYRWVKAFGFGDFTGIDLPGETRGLVRPPSRWTSLDLATIGFGQGIAVSPIQLTAALSSIANGGFRVRPYVVEKVLDAKGNEILRNEPKIGPKIISKAVGEMLKSYMLGVTEQDGTGSRARMPGFEVAGKTGTAQKLDPLTKEYTLDRTVSSFMGFVPVKEPKVAILVVIDEPKGGMFGGEIAAPVFKNIASKTLEYYHVIPGDMDLEFDEGLLAKDIKEEDLVLAAGEEGIDLATVPDFEGLSIREVNRMAQKAGLKILSRGTGIAFKQYPKAGSRIKGPKKCIVYFRPV